MEKQQVHPFFMFQGEAEEAVNLYQSVFSDVDIPFIERYGPEVEGMEGKILRAVIVIKGQEIMCSDSSIQHDFSFTPSMSLFITCHDEQELQDVFTKLSQVEKSVCKSIIMVLVSNLAGWKINSVLTGN